MEFVNIGTQDMDCELGATHNELRSFVHNVKHYNTFISKCVGQHQLFKSSPCVICSIVNIALDNHYINNEDHHFSGGESKKVKSNNLNKHKVLLKTPCLNKDVIDNMSEEYEKESHGDDGSIKDNGGGDGDRLAMLGEYNGDILVVNEENGDDAGNEKEAVDICKDDGDDNLGNENEAVDISKDNGEHEVTHVTEENQTNGMNGTEIVNYGTELWNNKKARNKKRKSSKEEKGKRKQARDNSICNSLPTTLKAPCLSAVERNDVFRRDIVNIVSFWFGYVGLSQVTSAVRQVIPRGRMGLSTIYEWVLSRRDNNSMKVLVIPICALSDSRLLLHQSYGFVFSDKEKVLAAYIHKDFDTDVPNFCMVPSIGWLTDVVLPKLKERAESKDLNLAPMSIDNTGEQSSI